MKFMNHYERPETPHVGCEPPRSYYIPFSNSVDAFDKPRERSDRALFLSGSWGFGYFDNPEAIPEDFFMGDPDTLDSISVPSCMETSGYGTPCYLQERYPFPYNPPHVPAGNPSGVYLRRFALDGATLQKKKVYLLFEGVDSCFYVWVNGLFCGYSSGSHNMTEIDVTGQVTKGENTVAVAVLKWCAGSYLENQDKWRFSGIFRDVYLLFRPENHLRDYTVTTELPSGQNRAVVTCTVDAGQGVATKGVLIDPDGHIIAHAQAADGQMRFSLDVPQLWNAETPVLYTLILECGGEFIAEKVGIRTVSVEDARLLVNGAPVKLKGVNRQEFDPKSGCTVALSHMTRDLLLMKKHNINAVRTAHCPNDPRFLQLCDALGFYVIDCADLQTRATPEQSMLNVCEDARFQNAVFDRVERLVERDKNRPCVLAWSIAHRSGWGEALSKSAQWTKKRDPSRPVQYTGGSVFSPPKTIDFISLFHPTRQTLKEIMKRRHIDRPVLLSEYACAQGNAPAHLEEYLQLMEGDDRLCGGFVWAWSEQGLRLGLTGDNRPKYGYGGDFGEQRHDGNNCIRGLLSPGRTPRAGLLHLKNALRPARFEAVDLQGGHLRVHNRLDFSDLSAYECLWEFSRNGRPVQRGSAGILSVPPHGTLDIHLGYVLPDDGRCFLRLSLIYCRETLWATEGYESGFDQFELPVKSILPAEPVRTGNISIREKDDCVQFVGESFVYEMDRKTALFSALKAFGKKLLDAPMEYSLWRAPTDSDRAEDWRRAGLDALTPQVNGLEITREDGNAVLVSARVTLSAHQNAPAAILRSTLRLYPDGVLQHQMEAALSPALPSLPRFGLLLPMPLKYAQVCYFGLGPIESYRDKRDGVYRGEFTLNAADMGENHIRPQESGNRHTTEWATLCDGEGHGLRFSSPEPFDFNVCRHTPTQLAAARHNWELPLPTCHTVCLDGFHSGVGWPDADSPPKTEKISCHLQIEPVRA